jgi:16S rRNA processing protein RimM
MNKNLIYIAQISKPHGVKGLAKLISLAEKAEDIFSYAQVFDDQMNPYKLKSHGQHNGNGFIVSFNDNTSRNLVEDLRGLKLYITRDMLPQINEDEFYNQDLKNLKILSPDLKEQGHILDVHNFGAGDIIEMKILNQKNTVFLPFNQEYIIEINLEKQYLIFDFAKAGIL